eukprot:6199770-Pleurochrysis_carterae.AAC.8
MSALTAAGETARGASSASTGASLSASALSAADKAAREASNASAGASRSAAVGTPARVGVGTITPGGARPRVKRVRWCVALGVSIVNDSVRRGGARSVRRVCWRVALRDCRRFRAVWMGRMHPFLRSSFLASSACFKVSLLAISLGVPVKSSLTVPICAECQVSAQSASSVKAPLNDSKRKYCALRVLLRLLLTHRFGVVLSKRAMSALDDVFLKRVVRGKQAATLRASCSGNGSLLLGTHRRLTIAIHIGSCMRARANFDFWWGTHEPSGCCACARAAW